MRRVPVSIVFGRPHKLRPSANTYSLEMVVHHGEAKSIMTLKQPRPQYAEEEK